ncbi:hypothetical protein HUN92_22900 [Bacillus firmus]|uniref:hypothetical protein n=1 Tax=Cytobacillus firmus TaxID=1399 RepID=UPI001580346A|nr:hypothetical protein [Cytobacillus firmus]NUH86477.1 hypothetical protein [Cytobacillus firmus]
MSKRKTELTEKKISEMQKEGRGSGNGEEYKPWINIQDFPSNGLATRGKGWKTNRIHQFLSKLERDYYYVSIADRMSRLCGVLSHCLRTTEPVNAEERATVY